MSSSEAMRSSMFAVSLASSVPDVVPQLLLVVVAEETDPGVIPQMLLVVCVGPGLLATVEGDPGLVPVTWLVTIPDEGVGSIVSSTVLPAGVNGSRP